MKRTGTLPLLIAALGLSAAPLSSLAAEKSLEVAVIGQVAPGYQRQKNANGGVKPERYAIANGGLAAGTLADESFRNVTFPMLSNVVGRHLASQRYFLAQKASDADLLIVVHWGATKAFEDDNASLSSDYASKFINGMNEVKARVEAAKRPNTAGGGAGASSGAPGGDQDIQTALANAAASELESSLTTLASENRARDLANLDNAKLLGYLDAVNARQDVSAVNASARDLIRDIEEKRYYVVVSAFDFRALREQNKQVLRWVTRMSIRATGNGFEERVAQMVAAGAGSFGKPRELHRRFYGDPHVELGETQFLGMTGTPAASATGK